VIVVATLSERGENACAALVGQLWRSCASRPDGLRVPRAELLHVETLLSAIKGKWPLSKIG
jgi:hypothetical protein